MELQVLSAKVSPRPISWKENLTQPVGRHRK